jgi:hypothetical protein
MRFLALVDLDAVVSMIFLLHSIDNFSPAVTEWALKICDM